MRCSRTGGRERRRFRHDDDGHSAASLRASCQHRSRREGRLGIPALHITQRYTDNEYEMAKDSMNVGEELWPRRRIRSDAKHFEMVPPGESIHELGTCRMGDDPKTSVLNKFNQAHDVRICLSWMAARSFPGVRRTPR